MQFDENNNHLKTVHYIANTFFIALKRIEGIEVSSQTIILVQSVPYLTDNVPFRIYGIVLSKTCVNITFFGDNYHGCGGIVFTHFLCNQQGEWRANDNSVIVRIASYRWSRAHAFPLIHQHPTQIQRNQ